MDHAAGILLEHGFDASRHQEAMPGRFLRVTGDWLELGVAETGVPYIAIAVDRVPKGGTCYAGEDVRTDWNGIELDDPQVQTPPWHAILIDQRRTRIGTEELDRTWDLIEVLLWLVRQFGRWPRSHAAGFLADDEAKIGVVWKEGPDGTKEYLRRLAPPDHAMQLVSRAGLVYTSHASIEYPAGWPEGRGVGRAGPLTIAGQMTCIHAIIQDRLRQLLHTADPGARLELLTTATSERTHPIDWGDAEAARLRLAQEELRRWRPQPAKTGKRSKRKAPLVKQERPLTAIETRTIEVVARHGSNFAAAAAELGKNPKTVRENWNRAMAKVNRGAGRQSRNVGTSPLPTDARGQMNGRVRRG